MEGSLHADESTSSGELAVALKYKDVKAPVGITN